MAHRSEKVIQICYCFQTGSLINPPLFLRTKNSCDLYECEDGITKARDNYSNCVLERPISYGLILVYIPTLRDYVSISNYHAIQLQQYFTVSRMFE